VAGPGLAARFRVSVVTMSDGIALRVRPDKPTSRPPSRRELGLWRFEAGEQHQVVGDDGGPDVGLEVVEPAPDAACSTIGAFEDGDAGLDPGAEVTQPAIDPLALGYWNMARQRYCRRLAPSCNTLRVSADPVAKPAAHRRPKSRGSRPSTAARGERRTLRWRKPDSNHRSRVTRPSFRRRLMSLA